MGKYDDKKMTYRSEDLSNTRKIKVQNILCDIASEITELKEVVDSFSKACEQPRPKRESWFKRLIKWGER